MFLIFRFFPHEFIKKSVFIYFFFFVQQVNLPFFFCKLSKSKLADFVFVNFIRKNESFLLFTKYSKTFLLVVFV